jgi:hypothetical protein
MSDVIDLPLESDAGHLVEPPIVDTLATDDVLRQWAISFIPEDSVSEREKEQVVVPFDSADGRRIRLRVQRLEGMLGHAIDRVFHAGDGNFTFHTRNGQTVSLSDSHGRVDLSVRAYVELTDIAMTAQIAFCTPSESAR